MAKIFITGSADGLGELAAKQLVKDGHDVVLHARDAHRAKQALAAVRGAKKVLTGDLSVIAEVKALAEQANALGHFDAVIHNAGVYQTDAQKLLAVNTLAPFILTCLMHRPKRLIYLSSGMHLSGDPHWTDRPSYSDTKLHVLMLAKAIARHWPDVYANVVDPGWVPTKMGGSGAPDNLTKGFETQVWLAVSNDARALVSGAYFHHQKESRSHQSADVRNLQEQLIAECERVTGVDFT